MEGEASSGINKYILLITKAAEHWHSRQLDAVGRCNNNALGIFLQFQYLIINLYA